MKFRILIIVCIFLCSSCVAEKTENQTTNRSYSVIYSNIPTSLISSSSDYDVQSLLFEGLLKFDENNRVANGLTKNYTISEDKITYKFFLKDNIYFSDSTKITAKDFEEFFKQILSPTSTFAFKEELYCIYGAKEYSEGAFDFSNVAIRAVSNSELNIRLNYVNDDLIKILASPELSLRKEKVNSTDFETTFNEFENNYKNILYTGMFLIGDYDDKELSLYINKNYYDANKVKKDKIIIKNNEYTEKALVDFEKKYIDVVFNPPESQFSVLNENGNLQFVSNSNVVSIYMNEANLSLDDRILIYNSISINEIMDKDFQYINGKIEEINMFQKPKTDKKTLTKEKLVVVTDNEVKYIKMYGNIEKQIKKAFNIEITVQYVDKKDIGTYDKGDIYIIAVPNLVKTNKSILNSFHKIYKNNIELNNMIQVANMGNDKFKVNQAIEYLDGNVVFKPLFYDFNTIATYNLMSMLAEGNYMKEYAINN